MIFSAQGVKCRYCPLLLSLMGITQGNSILYLCIIQKRKNYLTKTYNHENHKNFVLGV